MVRPEDFVAHSWREAWDADKSVWMMLVASSMLALVVEVLVFGSIAKPRRIVIHHLGYVVCAAV